MLCCTDLIELITLFRHLLQYIWAGEDWFQVLPGRLTGQPVVQQLLHHRPQHIHAANPHDKVYALLPCRVTCATPELMGRLHKLGSLGPFTSCVGSPRHNKLVNGKPGRCLVPEQLSIASPMTEPQPPVA